MPTRRRKVANKRELQHPCLFFECEPRAGTKFGSWIEIEKGTIMYL